MEIPFKYCAADYDTYRPGYPSGLYDFLTDRCSLEPSSLILDVGGGTGKGSMLFLKRGLRVIAIDAVEDMLKRAPQTERIVAFAEELGLKNSIADLVLCAQSFHWFTTVATLKEFRSTLKTSGYLALVWNSLDTAPLHQQEYERLIKQFNPEHNCKYRNKNWALILEKSGIFKIIEHKRYSQKRPMSVEDWKGLARSTSYIRSIGEERLVEFEKELAKIMKEQPIRNLQYTTEVWLAQPSS